MNKSFRFIALALVVSMLTALSTGCGGSVAPSGASEPTVTAPENSPTASASEEQGNAPVAEGGLVNEGDPINILVTYAPIDAKTDNAVKVLEEVTGYDVEYDMLPEQNALDKLNLIFSSGDIPYDLITIGATDNDKSVYATYAKKNLLTDLTDELPKYEHLSKMDAMGVDAVRVEGRVYAIGSTGLPYTGDTLSVRTDWLEQLGMPIPTTRQELYDVLVAFKEKDPEGIGGDLIPMIAIPGTIISTIGSTFGFLYDYEERDGKIVDIRLTPEYKDYLSFMNQLYSEKLLDQDMPVNTGTTVSEKVAASRVGVYSGGTDPGRYLWVAKNEAGVEGGPFLDIIAPLKDDNGVQRASSLSGLFRIGMIPKSSQKADMVLQFLDNFRKDENYEYLIHGDEGVDYEIVDNERTPIIPNFDENRGNLYHLSPLQDGWFYFPLWIMRTRKTYEGGVLFAKTFEAAGDYLVLNPLAFAPAFDSVSQDIKSVADYAQQEATKFIAGARSLDEFDIFVQEMKDKGADKVTDAFNEWRSAS